MNPQALKLPQDPELHVAQELSSEPLHVCVYNAVQAYFGNMDGHEVRGLYQLIMAEVEKPLLRAVLEQADGTQTRAAGILGISRTTVRKKIADYELS